MKIVFNNIINNNKIHMHVTVFQFLNVFSEWHMTAYTTKYFST